MCVCVCVCIYIYIYIDIYRYRYRYRYRYIDIYYIFKKSKIKLKYSCNSEFHAKGIIRHVISFWSKNKQKIFLMFRIKMCKNINTHKSKFHCFFFAIFSKNFYKCLHLLKSSDFLFNMVFVVWLIIQSFSVNLHIVELALPYTLSTTFPWILYFVNSVWYWSLIYLASRLWLL